eukprot:13337373-Ditylum_brightwellii.AAC.1
MHMMRANTAFVYCDARACYNRIVVIISALSEQAAGLPREQSIVFAKTLTKLQYSMTTAYGVSELYNIHSQENSIHGVGQGPCNAPSKWICTINTPLKCYDDNAKGCAIQDPTWQINASRIQK